MQINADIKISINCLTLKMYAAYNVRGSHSVPKKKISQNLKKKIKKKIASLGINISQVDAPFKATKR